MMSPLSPFDMIIIIFIKVFKKITLPPVQVSYNSYSRYLCNYKSCPKQEGFVLP